MIQASLMGFLLRDGEKVPAASRGRMEAPTQPFPGGADMEKEFVVFTRSESRGGFIKTPLGQMQYLEMRMWHRSGPGAQEEATPWIRMYPDQMEQLAAHLQRNRDVQKESLIPTTPSHPKH
ncbi:hypothetical protein P245_25660 [Comamonas thiooxydans]|uniref:Uncharacterized protein n=1 Tax=Comamonas thiooxydans TaxID=363952 RepID=A0A0E3BDJ6_9BURK|nr:hypothetical protein P245_25660 [Comamonas thiooxydans]